VSRVGRPYRIVYFVGNCGECLLDGDVRSANNLRIREAEQRWRDHRRGEHHEDGGGKHVFANDAMRESVAGHDQPNLAA